jgi:hypothetical protein
LNAKLATKIHFKVLKLQQSSALIETLEKKNVEIEKELEKAKKELKDAKDEADKKEEKYRV